MSYLRTCRKCGEVKPIRRFGRTPSGHYRHTCNRCQHRLSRTGDGVARKGKRCHLCEGLPHRVEGERCRRCGLEYRAEVYRVEILSWSPIARAGGV